MTIKVMKQAKEALGCGRIMAADADGNYTREVTPKVVTDAIAALDQAISQPDCRGCKNFGLCYFSAEGLICTNGDKFQALPKVMLYKVT